MCHRSLGMSPLPIKLAKITVIVIFFCFAECAAGSCLSYGHACWGAHGKRNSAHGSIPIREQPPISRDSQWFLSRLVQSPLDLQYINGRDLEGSQNRQLLSDAQIESEALKGQDDFRNLQDSYSNDDSVLFDEIYSNQRPRSHKNKVSKLLDKRSARMI